MYRGIASIDWLFCEVWVTVFSGSFGVHGLTTEEIFYQVWGNGPRTVYFYYGYRRSPGLSPTGGSGYLSEWGYFVERIRRYFLMLPILFCLFLARSILR